MLNIVTRHTVHDLRHSRIATLLAVTVAQAQGSQKAETVNRKGRDITTTGEHIPVQNHMDTIHYSAQAHLHCDKICWNILSSKQKSVYIVHNTWQMCTKARMSPNMLSLLANMSCGLWSGKCRSVWEKTHAQLPIHKAVLSQPKLHAKAYVHQNS